ncbi:MAG: hypothetical protein LUD02_08070 [Tannerellaceae bacterium]|nr:hypothetical protein [Tannerellaceae bacterium]
MKNRKFLSKDPEATKKNAEIATEISKYTEVGNLWDKQGKNWSPKELSHYFDIEKQLKAPEVKILSIEDLIQERINFHE